MEDSSRENPRSWIGNRYELIDAIGSGEMGVVYSARDRLSDEIFALKCIHAAGDPRAAGLRLALTREFRMLSTLHHPNIIGVRTYGFDAEAGPFFTMELKRRATTLLESARGEPQGRRLELLLQLLRALVYLARRDIIHCDLKPTNVLVEQGEVFVLDFGLSSLRGETQSAYGSLAYMAPEVVLGDPFSEASDLYAVGVLAYEMFAERHPYDATDESTLLQQLFERQPDLDAIAADRPIRALIGRLLAKRPADRPATAAAVIDEMAEAGISAAVSETTTTRDSLLQAARLVGRQAELDRLRALLERARAGRGGVVFVQGESGVGKSRLVEELRVQALVTGTLVLRGQAISEGRAPYELWRGVLRELILHAQPTHDEASVLLELTPELPRVLGETVAPATVLDPDAAQRRLHGVVETLLSRCTQPCLVLLEDLQWAGSESRELLASLARSACDRGLLLVATTRSDGAPLGPHHELIDEIIRLPRLAPGDVAELTAAMLGPAGEERRLTDYLVEQTEGNPFFLVEVLRELAARSERLDRLDTTDQPLPAFAAGIRRLVDRRLARVAPQARDLLRVAAVAGRALDLELLRTIAPTANLELWLDRCADDAVLEVADGQWRFAHDKLREALVDELDDPARTSAHRRVALAMESQSPKRTRVAALALHWRGAAEPAKERRYTALAGEQAVANAAHAEAIDWLERTVELDRMPSGRGDETTALERARWQRLLGEAWLGLGQPERARTHLFRALTKLGRTTASSRPQQLFAVAIQTGRQLSHSLWPKRFVAGERSPTGEARRRILLEAVRCYEHLMQVHYHASEPLEMLHAALCTLNLAEAAGPSSELAAAYANMHGTVGLIPWHALAQRYARLAFETAGRLADDRALLWVLWLHGYYCLGNGLWQRGREVFSDQARLAERIGYRKQWETAIGGLAWIDTFVGDRAAGAAGWLRVYESAKERDPQSQAWAQLYLCAHHLAEDELDRARSAVEDAERCRARQPLGREVDAWTLAMRALVDLRRGRPGAALGAAGGAATLLAKGPPVGFFLLDSYAAVAQVYLELIGPAPGAAGEGLASALQQACRALGRYTRVFPIGKPAALRYEAQARRLRGRHALARRRLQASISAARELGMPYEEGLSHLAIGSGLAPGAPGRRFHLERAEAILARTGGRLYRERARVQLASC